MRLAGGSLAFLVLFASACSASNAQLDRSLYTVNVCEAGRWDELGNITPADPARYIELDVKSSILGAAPMGFGPSSRPSTRPRMRP